MVTKGAPESVLARCTAVSPLAEATLDGLFTEGARVVAVATRPASANAKLQAGDERDLTLVGFLMFVDGPRPDAGEAISRLRGLGIEVKIITGDNGTVAATVCRQIGVDPGTVLSGPEIEAMDDDALMRAITVTRVFRIVW
jgi:Mg2+-importing ATPase